MTTDMCLEESNSLEFWEEETRLQTDTDGML
jgi:hypothetical protein